MTRYTFDPRPLWKPRAGQREVQIGIADAGIEHGSRTIARICAPVAHAHAARMAAQAYCDVLNALEGIASDSHATVVLCKGGEARVVVRGRVVARCDAFDNGLNEAWAGLIALLLNTADGLWPVGNEVPRV